MYYNGKQLGIEEYFMERMGELGFAGNDKEQVDGYCRSEAEYNIVADYASSCGLSTNEEKEFAAMHGYDIEKEEER